MKTIHFPNLKKLFAIVVAAGLVNSSSAATYTVTNTLNTGAGSLRQAITDANSNPGTDVIVFNISTGGANVFENDGAGNSWATIILTSTLPTITEAVLIDGFTQTNTNTGALAGRTVGVDNFVQPSINYPDVLITRSYALTNTTTGTANNGITINAVGVTIRGIAISGFGNTSTDAASASVHGDIMLLRSSTIRNINTDINNCFIGCTPRGALPVAARRSRANGVLIAGNNYVGSIKNNLFAYCGTYSVQFNGTNNIMSLPATGNLPNRGWDISQNQMIFTGTNTGATTSRVGDAINTMHSNRLNIEYNYIEQFEQVAVDIGWNSDSNVVRNNTITGQTLTTATTLPVAGIRVAASSQYDTIVKNEIYNNTGTLFRSGIWTDISSISGTGLVSRDNLYNYVSQNEIYNNTGNGITMSTNVGAGAVNAYTVFSQNSTYNNTGLGIDLNYNLAAGPITVSVNDDGDVDAGGNNIQNFPLIDSVKKYSASDVIIYGKAPAGATIEFFISDGGVNQFGVTLNYGEGRTYIGTGVEGSASDMRTGTGSYNVDGNIASGNVNLFAFHFNNAVVTGLNTTTDRLTSTATLGGSTSEFGPVVTTLSALGCQLMNFSAAKNQDKVNLYWDAFCDPNFKYFDIEKSVDGRNFTRIGTVSQIVRNGKGDYQHVDAYPNTGVNYYRLRMVDDNGVVKYSSIITVNFGVSPKSSQLLTTTLFTNKIDMVYQSEVEEKVAVQLFNAAGSVVKSEMVMLKKGTNYMNLDHLSALKPGTYHLVVKGTTVNLHEAMVKQ